MAAPISSVVALPPMSGVRTFDRAKVSAIAVSTASAASITPRCLSIMAPDQICPMGFAMPFPAMSGAGQIEGESQDALYSTSGEDCLLNGHFLIRPLIETATNV